MRLARESTIVAGSKACVWRESTIVALLPASSGEKVPEGRMRVLGRSSHPSGSLTRACRHGATHCESGLYREGAHAMAVRPVFGLIGTRREEPWDSRSVFYADVLALTLRIRLDVSYATVDVRSQSRPADIPAATSEIQWTPR